MTTGKTIALTRWTFVGKVVSLIFNKLPRLVIGFLPRSKCLLISWLQSPSAVILEPKKRKSVIASTFSPSICHDVMGPDAIILVFLMFNMTKKENKSKPLVIRKKSVLKTNYFCFSLLLKRITLLLLLLWTESLTLKRTGVFWKCESKMKATIWL